MMMTMLEKKKIISCCEEARTQKKKPRPNVNIIKFFVLSRSHSASKPRSDEFEYKRKREILTGEQTTAATPAQKCDDYKNECCDKKALRRFEIGTLLNVIIKVF